MIIGKEATVSPIIIDPPEAPRIEQDFVIAIDDAVAPAPSQTHQQLFDAQIARLRVPVFSHSTGMRGAELSARIPTPEADAVAESVVHYPQPAEHEIEPIL